MKKAALMMMTMLVSSVMFADLAGARGKIGDAIQNPSQVAELMSGLTNAEQQTLVSEMNAAISGMGGSAEEKAATFINVNKAALRSANKGNLSSLVAEVFATVPPEMLTILNETFASDLFSRGADASVTYSDEAFTKISKNLISKVADRAAKTDDAAVRTSFAILMMVNASGGTPENLVDALSASIPEKSRDIATQEWIPAALGKTEDGSKSYANLLSGVSQTVSDSAEPTIREPNPVIALRISGVQYLDAMLADLSSSAADADSPMHMIDSANVQIIDPFSATTMEFGLNTKPRGPNAGEVFKEPGGYQWQEL